MMLKTISSCLLTCCLPLFVTLAFSHDGQREIDIEKEYPTFKEMLHVFSAGHGASHLTQDEIRPFFKKFKDHLDDVIFVQKNAPKDKYLAQLIGFVSTSNLSDEQKYERYRASYNRCLAEAQNGNEWHRTLYFLVTKTDIPTRADLEQYQDAKNKSLRMASERMLKSRVFERNRNRKVLTKTDRKRPNMSGSNIAEHNKDNSSDDSPPVWAYSLCVVLLLAGVASVITVSRKKAQSDSSVIKRSSP